MNIKFIPSILLILFASLLIVGCTELPSSTPPQAAPPQSASQSGSVTLLDENGNRVLIETDSDNHALIQIFSEQGRGNADIAIANATYPSQVTVRLHLKGLEELSIRHADGVHTLSISSVSNPATFQSVTDAMGERTLTQDAPEWMAVELVDTRAQAASTQPTIPLEEGYIDVTLPPSFAQQQIRNFTIQWIDFYR